MLVQGLYQKQNIQKVYSGQHTKINKDTDMILNVNDHRNEYTHVETRHVFGYMAVQLNSVVLVK